MPLASLLDQTRARFPDLLPGEIAVTPLEKGGSDRKFYRIDTGERSLILVKYSEQRVENRHYVEVAHFLGDHGINVPQIYHHDPAEGLIWMQDLGGIDLWAFRAEPWEIRRAHYRTALEQAARLHRLTSQNAAGLTLQPAFDETLYRWEQHYFFDHCLRRHFHLETNLAADPAFSAIAARLARLPRVLVHRDFQSQNIMIRDESAWLIDFQGLRPGLPQYDLASLLYDPYVDLTSAERAELLEFYRSLASRHDSHFQETFHLCALQRLLQALGAYGFLGYEKHKPEFLQHIPTALASLRAVLEKIDGLDELKKILAPL